MFKLSDYIGEELSLVPPSFFKLNYELRRGEELLAKMYYPKFFSTNVIVEILEDKYEIIRPSFWKNEAAIRKYAYDLPFASAATNLFLTRGTIDLKNGHIINIKFGRFSNSCQLLDESNELLLVIRNKISFKGKKVVTIEKKSELIDKNPWVIMMTWFLFLQRKGNAIIASS